MTDKCKVCEEEAEFKCTNCQDTPFCGSHKVMHVQETGHVNFKNISDMRALELRNKLNISKVVRSNIDELTKATNGVIEHIRKKLSELVEQYKSTCSSAADPSEVKKISIINEDLERLFETIDYAYLFSYDHEKEKRNTEQKDRKVREDQKYSLLESQLNFQNNKYQDLLNKVENEKRELKMKHESEMKEFKDSLDKDKYKVQLELNTYKKNENFKNSCALCQYDIFKFNSWEKTKKIRFLSILDLKYFNSYYCGSDAFPIHELVLSKDQSYLYTCKRYIG